MTGREDLAGSVRVEGSLAIVTVVGEIDIQTLNAFRDLLDRAVAAGAPRVDIDMSGVEFCDAQGLRVLIGASDRLHALGSRLTVRGVTEPVYQVFESTALSGLLRVDRPLVSSALVRGLARTARIPFTRDVLDAALKLVVTMAQAVVVGADGASITLPRQGQLATVAASNDTVSEMDHDQYDTGEGPCLDAATEGKRFHIDSLGAEDRWPAFVPRARARGIESILSTPLVSAERPIGALNIYSRTEGAFAVHEKQWADQFASEAAVVVQSAEVGPSGHSLSAQIEQALESREVIALAQGIVMHRDGLTAGVAHNQIRDISRRTGQPLFDVCRALVLANGSPGDELPDGSDHGPARL